MLVVILLVICCRQAGEASFGVQFDDKYDAGIPLHEYVKKACMPAPDHRENKKTVAIFIEFLRFGCLACLNEFLDFCDTLKAVSDAYGNVGVILIFKRDHQEEDQQYRQMKSWIKGTGLNFRFRIAPPELFDENHITEISLLILDRNYEFNYYNQFPLTMRKKEEILGILCEGVRRDR